MKAPTSTSAPAPCLSQNLSHEFDMSNWKPDRTARIKNSNLYLWIVPAQVEGSWQLFDPAFADKPGSGGTCKFLREYPGASAPTVRGAKRRSRGV